jgi:hypothetical protein
MRTGNRINKNAGKHLARRKYKERKIDTYIKWSVNKRGYLKWKDLIMIHEQYNIKCYG